MAQRDLHPGAKIGRFTTNYDNLLYENIEKSTTIIFGVSAILVN